MVAELARSGGRGGGGDKVGRAQAAGVDLADGRAEDHAAAGAVDVNRVELAHAELVGALPQLWQDDREAARERDRRRLGDERPVTDRRCQRRRR